MRKSERARSTKTKLLKKRKRFKGLINVVRSRQGRAKLYGLHDQFERVSET